MYYLSCHLMEIRLRFFYIVLSLVLSLITCYYYQFELLYIIGRPFLKLDHKFILIDLTEAFYTIIRICGIFTIFTILPFFIYHLWSFYIPSRYQFERKSINKIIVFFLFILVLEILFLYFLLFPKICEFLLSFQLNSSEVSFSQLKIDNILENKNMVNESLEKELNNQLNFHTIKENQINKNNTNDLVYSTKSLQKKIPVVIELTARLESYVKLSTQFFLITLIFYQIPFFIVIFYYYNLFDYSILCNFRKIFFFSTLLISAFISPPDIISQLVVAILIFILYEFLIFLGIFIEYFTGFNFIK